MTHPISPQIRTARPEDASILVDFNRAMAKETENKELHQETVTAGVNALLANPQMGFYVIAEVEERTIAGSLMVTTEWSDWRNGTFWWIQSVYVQPAYRRQGIYSQLYHYVKEQAFQAKNVCGFRLYVEQENYVAQQTYQKLGMHETYYRLYEAAASRLLEKEAWTQINRDER